MLGLGFLILRKKNIREKTAIIQLTSVFGGAFLLAICFLDLAPHIYEGHSHNVENGGESHMISMGVFVLIGFLIQQLLDLLSKGLEHGHLHTSNFSWNTVFSLLTGLCIHAFLEGMPIITGDNEMQTGLVWGIIIHNIPITFVLTSVFIGTGYSFKKSMLLLLVFAIMTPLGSIVNRTFLAGEIPWIEDIITALVVGILLHVSISILFSHENEEKLKLAKFITIVAAFVVAYLIPVCSHG